MFWRNVLININIHATLTFLETTLDQEAITKSAYFQHNDIQMMSFVNVDESGVHYECFKLASSQQTALHITEVTVRDQWQ